jgi:peptide/nickel transport system substrate-binding protein
MLWSRWQRRVLVSAAIATLTVSGTGAAAGSATAGEPAMIIALPQQVDSLNPFVGISAPAVQLFGLMYDRLTEYRTADNQPVPGLAESWTQSADGLTWTFTIRDGVRWSDGRPLTAADIAFTYTTVMRNPGAVSAAAVKTFSSVTAPDARTLVITTSVRTPTMLTLDIPIVPEHLWRTADPLGEPPDAANPVGSGPYRLVEAAPARQYRLVRRPGHWRAEPRLPQLVFRYFTNTDAAAQALRKGEIDVATNLTPAQFDALAEEPDIATNVARGSRFTHLGFNPGATRVDGRPIGDGHPALRDPAVRSAIEHAVDRRLLVERVLGGHGDPGAGYFPPTYRPWSWEPGPAQRRDFDPAAAERLLDAAGYPRGPDGERRLRLRLYAPVERPHYQQSGQFIVQWLRALGIEVELTAMADTQLGERIDAGRFDLFLSGWLLDPDPDFLLSVHTCGARPDAGGSGTTDAYVCDAGYDELYRRQSVEMDPARRTDLVRRAQERLHAITAQVTLYYPGVLEAYRRDRFTGLTQRPAGSGSIAGPWSYLAARPVASAAPERGGPGPAVFAGLTLLAVALGGAVLAGVRYRRLRDRRE